MALKKPTLSALVLFLCVRIEYISAAFKFSFPFRPITIFCLIITLTKKNSPFLSPYFSYSSSGEKLWKHQENSILGDHILQFHDLSDWISNDIIRRNLILIIFFFNRQDHPVRHEVPRHREWRSHRQETYLESHLCPQQMLNPHWTPALPL